MGLNERHDVYKTSYFVGDFKSMSGDMSGDMSGASNYNVLLNDCI